MPRIKHMLLVFFFTILLTACSFSTWSHTYEGNSSNWQIVMEVVPHKEYGAMFIGKLDQNTVQPIQHVHYEVEEKWRAWRESETARFSKRSHTNIYRLSKLR